LIKKRIKIQFKKAVSMFMGAALPGIMCTILLSVCLAGCKSIPAIPEKDQAGENQQQEQMKESKDTDPSQEKKTQAEKDTQNSGKSTAQDDGSTAGPPVIWNRKMPEDVVLPASYDYREQGRAPKIGNQGSLGTCWAFASLTALESTLLPDQKETFSVDHMSMHNHFLLGQDEGGEYTMSMAYLLSWEGPVWESEDPYGDGISPDGLKAREHVQEIQILPSKDYEAIKRAVYLEGGVQSSLYTSMQDYESESIYYNRDTNSYCYIGTEKPNHDSVIVGWDDDFPKENFNMDLEGDGAFICTNSWGEDFGDQGYFYVSYYDTNIGVHNIVYTGIEPTDNYDKIYQSDLCGWVGQIGYGKDTAWFANAYRTEKREELAAAGFYATGPDTEYKIYVARYLPDKDGSDAAGKDRFSQDHGLESALNRRTLLAEGVLEYSGYYTIPFDQKIVLDQGEKFAIIVEIKTPDTVHPVAIEYDAGDGIAQVTMADGEGYLSHNGSLWEHVEETQKCNLCLKVYTDTK
jgi:C1A family cysteine protease